ncbi:MAG: hypothetical protein HY062_05635 [Bacteroidetes bacterium]|nr:hypothetical protein [Bacteroidota bacterium]
MKRLFILAFILQWLCGFAQAKKTADVFENAYVVTLKGDTIKGQLKMPKTKKIELYQKINFKDPSNKVRLYTPDKIKGYGYDNYYYISAFHNNRSCYFKVLSQGKVSLYQTVFEVTEDGVANEIHEFCVMEEKGDGQFKIVDEKGLKKQLKDLFKSNKSLVQKINDQKEITFNEQTLESYFKEFNEASAGN